MTKEQRGKSEMGLRFNEGKPKWGLVDFASLIPMIRVLEHGAEKYAVDNWKKGMPPREVLECLQRHLAALFDGEKDDKESGVPHIGHIMANAMFYSYFTEVQTEEKVQQVDGIEVGDIVEYRYGDNKSPFREYYVTATVFKLYHGTRQAHIEYHDKSNDCRQAIVMIDNLRKKL